MQSFIPLRIVFLRMALIAGLAFIIAAGFTVLGEVYLKTVQIQAMNQTQAILGTRGYAAYIAVQSVDPAARVLVATVKSYATRTDMPIILKLTNDFRVERQDPIIIDGSFVGVLPVKPATLNDLTLGTLGIAFLTLKTDGTTTISYLLIGSPFPHP